MEQWRHGGEHLSTQHWGVEAGDQTSRSPSQHSELQASLGYVRSCLKKRGMEGKEKEMLGGETGMEGGERDKYLDLGESTP